AGWQMTAVELRSIDDSSAWIVEARERRGRQQTLTVEASTGITVRAEADVFMGQGDQFRLTLARSSVKPLDQKTSDATAELQSELMALQSALKRRPDSHLNELSARQIADANAVSERLTTFSKGTPLELLVRRMKTDVELQQQRLASTANRAAELLNGNAPDFVLSLVNGEKLESGSLKGKTVILHFWDYRDAPLSEPYGQTGYLEFLYNQKKKLNVAVVGVSTNPDLQSKENLNRGRRSVRKLSEFMNLSYPIGHDDGSLLKSFGDPRDTRGQLPLWIVINPDGKVAHYHAGYYEVDAAQGLKELESLLTDLIRGKK
ncbi:MAG: redoxin family protein, partial [Planctomycetota bacterium]|nr:redoxin family protein [Planctomycetota bacterium]